MSDAPRCQIGEAEVDFAEVWAHLQSPLRTPGTPFSIFVPDSMAQELFATHDSPARYVEELVAELGTFAVDGIINVLRGRCGSTTRPYQWVIAAVDEVDATEAGINIRGRAVRFAPSLYQRPDTT